MKEKMLEFLIKRMSGKIDDLRNIDYEYADDATHKLVQFVTDDLDTYLETMKDIIGGVLLP